MVDFRGGGAVYVGAAEEGLGHCGVAAEVGHEPQLYLRIVGGKQQIAFVGNEGAAYVSAVGRAYGDILQVGICR